MGIALSAEQKQFYILYIDLLASVLNGTQPPSLPEDFNWEYACRNAQNNSVANILSYTLDKVNVKPSQTVINVLKNEQRLHILKETSQLFDVEKVLAQFEKEGIKNIPLKGYFMKHLYPQTDLRTMTDIDILVDKRDFKKIEQVFLNLGYKNANVLNAREIHFKRDLLYFEIQSTINSNNDSFFDDIWSRVKPRDGYSYSYEMLPEDFYLYMVYHTAKHFKSGGMGIRMVMDICVFLNACPNLNFDYISERLREMELSAYEQKLRELSVNWFSAEPTQINAFGEFVLYCSTYGQRVVSFFQSNQRTEHGYWIKQFFPPYSRMKGLYDYLEKFPILLPFSWVQYWGRRALFDRDIHIKRGITERANNLDKESGEFLINLMNELEIK